MSRAILACAILVVGCSSTAAPPGPSGTAVGSPSAGPVVAKWTASQVPGLGETYLTDIALLRDTIVVVGRTSSGPVVVTSTDGRTWTVTPQQASFDTHGGAGMASIVLFRDKLVAVGPGDSQSVVWHSTDGTVWTKVYESRSQDDPDAGDAPRFDGAMTRVRTDGDALVAVGRNGPGLVDDFGGAAWYSTDGIAWEASPSVTQLLRAPLSDLGTVADGTVVAVGGVRGVVSLTSSDGRTWTLHEQKDTLGEGSIWSLTDTAASGLAAVGSDGDGAFSATSEDGAKWQRGRCTGALARGRMQAVLRTPTGFVAAGAVDVSPAIWVSTDAQTWSLVKTDLGDGEIAELFMANGMIVAVGTGLWIGPGDGVGENGTYPETACGTSPAPAPSDAVEPEPAGSGQAEPAEPAETPTEPAPAEPAPAEPAPTG